MEIKELLLLIFIAYLRLTCVAHGNSVLEGDHGDPKYDMLLSNNSIVDDAKSLRDMIQKINLPKKAEIKSPLDLSELRSVRENLLKLPASEAFSTNLSKILNDELVKVKNVETTPILGMEAKMEASEAIADPSINVIDSHISQIIKTTNDNRFQPDFEEMKKIANEKHEDSNLHNLLRENLFVESIQEEANFRLGAGVEQWKVLTINHEKVALIGRTSTSIVVAVGHGDSYELTTTLEFNIMPKTRFLVETLRIFDSKLNRARNLVLVALQGQLIWYELMENDLIEIHRWNLLKEIESLIHFTHEGSEILVLTTVDEAKKVQAEFIEFNLPESEFWVIQAFTLPERSPSMTCLDLGGDVIVAFVQNNSLSIYRHQFTKHLRGKFSHFKTIRAANTSVVSGFRIGGHSYLAIGGDQPQILRYFNGDFHQQTILSQTFGFVEEFLPIPIRTYRDDLVLLVQHRLDLGSHTLVVVDALVWNGIAFENALSVPCHILADPNANGFTCMLDSERDDGFLGAAFIHHEKQNGLYMLIPRVDAHSGMFRINYTFVDAENPLMKEMDQIKKSIELINQMLDYEKTVKEEVEDVLKVAMDPNNDFILDGVKWIDELETDLLELDGNVELEDNIVEFFDSTWTQEDFLVNLDKLEAMITADEHKLRMIDDELNKLNRINRQTNEERDKESPIIRLGAFAMNGYIEPKTINTLPKGHARPPRQRHQEGQPPVHNVGYHTLNGQLDPKTIRTIPQSEDNQRIPRQVQPMEESNVKSLRVKNLQLESINGIPFAELIFLENGQLVLPNGNLSFLDFVQTENINMLNNGRVNGIDFSHEVLAIQSPNPPKHLVLENVVVQSLDIEMLNNVAVDLKSLETINVPFNVQPNLTAKSVNMRNSLNVETINGIGWNEFVKKLVPKHLPSSINEITVAGDVLVVEAGQLNATFLNKILFSSEYVLKEGPRDTVITGKKTFVGDVVTTAIDTNGEIDGIKPSNMISLDQEQRITAETTFKNLEVIRKLEVNGTIAGKELHEFLPNPTLAETKQILAACNFKELIVEGKLTIEGTLNGKKLESVLADVVYETRDNSETIINAPKSFIDLKVTGDVETSNNVINDMNLNNIMITDRDQSLSLAKLSGDVFISDLKLTGLFDGVNAAELEHNSFRTFGDQFIETPVIIRNGHQVEAVSADVKNSLNRIIVGDFLLIDQVVNFADKDLFFDHLNSENVILNGDIVGHGVFKNLNISDLNSVFLSKSRTQDIRVATVIKSLSTNGTFFAKSINGVNFGTFRKYMHGIRDFKSLVLSGEQKLDNLIVDGSVKLNRINGKDFNKIVQNVIWLNRPNTVNGNLKFLDDVTIDGLVTVRDKFNMKSFKAFTENWISNQEKSIVINSDKFFNKNVMVEESLVAESINNINFEDLLMIKDAEQLTKLDIQGNVNAKHLVVDGTVNGKIVRDFEKLYWYNVSSDTHFVHGDVHFNQPAVVDYLNTHIINQFSVNLLMLNLIRLDEGNILITSEKTFTNQVVAQQGFYAESINEIAMEFLDKVVFANDPTLVSINGDLNFVGDVYAQFIGIKGELYTKYISNCDSREWQHQALNIDNEVNLNGVMHINSSAFKPSVNLRADYLNGLPLANLFTLKTNQTFEHIINVLGSVEVTHPLIVQGYVNGVFIEQERANTLMRNEKHQVVTVKTSFNRALIYGPLTTYGKVNSKELQNIVLLNSSPTIDSAINFRSLEGSSLYTNNLISGSNFNKWYENVLWNQGKDVQTVSGNWKIKKLRIKDDVSGNGLINDISISEIENNLKNSINAIDVAITDHSGKYQELCKILEVKGNNSKNSIHILKHFEINFKLQESLEIFSYFMFRLPSHQDYIAVNTNCTTQIYKWQRETERFKFVGQVVTGVIYNWAIVENLKNDVFIITNSRMEVDYPCPFGGVNVWKMNEDQMFHVNTIPTDSDVLELHVNPLLPGRFFTLNNIDVVEHFDVFGEKKEFWKLPLENYNYSFVPSDVIGDLTLFNGQKLFMLESKFKNRQARFLFDKTSNSKDAKPLIRSGESPIFRPGSAVGRQFMIPSIPSKPLFQNNLQNDRNIDVNADKNGNMVTRIQQVENAFRKSLNDAFSKVSKLTIKDTNIEPNDKRNKNDYDSSEMEAEENVSLKPEPIALTENPFEVSSALSDDLSSTVEPISKIKASNFTTEKLDERTEPENSFVVKNQKLLTSFAPGLSTEKEFFTTKLSSESKEDSSSTTDASVSSFVDKLRNVRKGIKNALGLKKNLNETLTSSQNKESSVDVHSQQVEFTSEASTESITEVSTSTLIESADTTGSSPKDLIHENVTEAVTESENSLKQTTVTEGSKKLPVFSVTPKIFFPSTTQEEEFAEKGLENETSKILETMENAVEEVEQQVPVKVLTGSGLKEAENPYFPEHGAGEFVMMYVGPDQRKKVLYAVTRTRDSIIKGNHNIIEIYNDIFEGSIYQYIQCTDPSNLSVLQFRDETLLAFLEGGNEIHAYIYRGIQGFVGFKRIKLPGYAVQMTSITLPPKIDYKCDRHYLLIRMETEIIFYGVKISGNCGIDEVKCDEN